MRPFNNTVNHNNSFKSMSPKPKMTNPSLRERLRQEVFERQGKIRYYSGFNLEGFFLGYDPGKQRFDKAEMSPEKHVWFYLDPEIVITNAQNHQPFDIGSVKDYLFYFVSNQIFKKGRAIISAAGSSMNYKNSSMHPNVQPCILSGLIPLEEIADASACNSWFMSKSSSVSVDKL